MFLVSDHRGENIQAYTREDFCYIFISGLIYQGLDIRYLDAMSIKTEDREISGNEFKARLRPYLPNEYARI